VEVGIVPVVLVAPVVALVAVRARWRRPVHADVVVIGPGGGNTIGDGAAAAHGHAAPVLVVGPSTDIGGAFLPIAAGRTVDGQATIHAVRVVAPFHPADVLMPASAVVQRADVIGIVGARPQVTLPAAVLGRPARRAAVAGGRRQERRVGVVLM